MNAVNRPERCFPAKPEGVRREQNEANNRVRMTVDAVINWPAPGDHLIGRYRLRWSHSFICWTEKGAASRLADKERNSCRRKLSLFREYLNFRRPVASVLSFKRSPAPNVHAFA